MVPLPGKEEGWMAPLPGKVEGGMATLSSNRRVDGSSAW